MDSEIIWQRPFVLWRYKYIYYSNFSLHYDIISIESYKTGQNYLNYKRLPSKIKSYLQVTRIQSDIYHPKNKISSKEDLKQQEMTVAFLTPNGSQKNHRQENKSSQKIEYGSLPVSFFTHLPFFSIRTDKPHIQK